MGATLTTHEIMWARTGWLDFREPRSANNQHAMRKRRGLAREWAEKSSAVAFGAEVRRAGLERPVAALHSRWSFFRRKKEHVVHD